MATQTIVSPSDVTVRRQPKVQNPATEYWSQHIRSVMVPLLKAAGTYSPSDQTSHLQFMDEYIAPNFGPLPTEPHSKYTTPSSLVGSPFDPSINITSSGKAKVRFDYDVIRPLDRTGADPFAEELSRQMLHHLASVVDADTQWLDSLTSSLYLSPEETEVARTKMPPHIAVPPSSVGIDFDGPKKTLKAYIPSVRKAIVTGRSPTDVMFEALRALEPMGTEIAPALDLLADYLANCQNDSTLILAGIDCVDPKDARLKCYIHTSSNAFDVVRDVMTLGGRLNDESSVKRAEILRSIWPLLLNEPESDGNAGTLDESWSKPELVPETGYSGLQYTIEITPGKPIPETKIYVPLFQYAETSEVAEKVFEGVLEKLGIEWGPSGKYKETMEAIFGSGKPYGQTYASFSYTKEKGVYTTSYFAMPIHEAAGLPGKFGLHH